MLMRAGSFPACADASGSIYTIQAKPTQKRRVSPLVEGLEKPKTWRPSRAFARGAVRWSRLRRAGTLLAHATGVQGAVADAVSKRIFASPIPSVHQKRRTLRNLGVIGMTGMPRKTHGRQQAGFLLEMLLALRMELSGRSEGWPGPTLANRQRALMAMWRDRCRTIFVDADVDRDIETWIGSAFTHAHAGRCANAALDLKRAYLLVCCVIAHRPPPMADAGKPATWDS
jgi:hypothetical protein